MLTAPNTRDFSSNSIGLPPNFTFRKQPTNGDDTVGLFPFVVPEWMREKKIFNKHWIVISHCSSFFQIPPHCWIQNNKYIRKLSGVSTIVASSGKEVCCRHLGPLKEKTQLFPHLFMYTHTSDIKSCWWFWRWRSRSGFLLRHGVYGEVEFFIFSGHWEKVTQSQQNWNSCTVFAYKPAFRQNKPLTRWNFPSQRVSRGVTATLTTPSPSSTSTTTWGSNVGSYK